MRLKDDDFRRVGGFCGHIYNQVTGLVDFGFQSFFICPRDEEIPDLLLFLARSWILGDFIEICESFGHGGWEWEVRCGEYI